MRKKLLLLLLSLSPFMLQAQTGFIHASGKQIVDGNGNNLLFRGIGTGNWMIQEGYMMQSADVVGTQWGFKQKLTETIGAEKTAQFYTSWLNNHFRKIDVDSMSRWGFNCVRPALHYKVFTLPIEDEPVAGQNTWLESGFTRLDSLVSWCAANHMYVILDLHGAPGGQGKDTNISDYNPAKPALWESELNKAKTVALWRKIAERYATNQWVAGYDLLNETNWTFPEGNNSQLRNLYGRITTAIREVDPNHLIIIEGNWFANDYSGLTPKWDNNMAYSFHKYWAYNDAGSIQWIVDFRNNTNCPVWLGESGENSNRWFTDCIKLMEDNNIGWSWWPVKKSGINNVLKVTTNSDYTALLDYWRGKVAKPTVENAFQAVMTFSENHKLENCTVQHDVIDAMMRQPYTTETLPYKANTTASTIYAVDYDLGRANYAYWDKTDADYHVSTDQFTAWNNGYAYRNDGVDIEGCTDAVTNRYSVGWIEDGEWMQYSIQSDAAMTYNVLLRHASASQSAVVHIEINGKRASKSYTLSPTGSWSTWRTTAIPNVIIPAGNFKIRVVFEKGGANFNYFQLRNPKTIESTSFEMLSAETANWADIVVLKTNKPIDVLIGNPFVITIDSKTTTILSTTVSTTDNSKIEIKIADPILYTSNLELNYTTNACSSGSQSLNQFQNTTIQNLTSPHQTIPGKIEVENFNANNGFSFETCTDTGGGTNSAYAARDKCLDYNVWIPKAGDYQLNFRVSANTSSASLTVLTNINETMTPLKTIYFSATGGWQNWQTQSTQVNLRTGKNIIRLLARSDGFNLNWFDFGLLTSIKEVISQSFKVFPNPTNANCTVKFDNPSERLIRIFDIMGNNLFQQKFNGDSYILNSKQLLPGTYIIKITEESRTYSKELLKL